MDRNELMALWDNTLKHEFPHLRWETTKHASFAVNTVNELRALLLRIEHKLTQTSSS